MAKDLSSLRIVRFYEKIFREFLFEKGLTSYWGNRGYKWEPVIISQVADQQTREKEEDSMELNIHQQVFNEDGEYLEKEGQRYRDQLVALFEASPEAQELQSEGIEPGWTSMLLRTSAEKTKRKMAKNSRKQNRKR